MDWFCLVATLWFIWLIFIIVSSIAIIVVLLQEIIERRKAKKRKFDKAFPQLSVFRTMLKNQKFPYGKWKYLGKDVSGEHLFERVK